MPRYVTGPLLLVNLPACPDWVIPPPPIDSERGTTVTEPIHVLAYGPIGVGVCDQYRLGMYRERLAALGVELRTWGDFNDYLVNVPLGYENRIEDAIRDGVAQIDRAPIEWADVIVFRRWHALTPSCNECDTVGPDGAAIEAHCAKVGHTPGVPDRIVASLVASFEERPEMLRGRAIVYETDDNLLTSLPHDGARRRLEADRWLSERIARRADLVTVTTPVLAQALGRFNDEVRVVRNAIDPAWYAGPLTGARPEGDPRILYYGGGSRIRDYDICRDAIDDVARREPGVRRVWLGSRAPAVLAMVDEALPYVEGVPAFAGALVGACPDIGVAPVVGDDYNRARSELHWLEYTMAGAATVASQSMGGGPYDVIRDGIDGLLARNKGQWREQLRRLVGSRTLRDDLAGHARERVLAEYTADRRAEEWADAYRWAAEHGGRGALPRRHAVGAAPLPAVARMAAESRGNLVHRQRARAEAAQAIQVLSERRGEAEVCWPAGADVNPLVTVIIPTHQGGRLIASRTLTSVVAQSHVNLEILVVGDDATAETVAAVGAVQDPRIRFVHLPGQEAQPDDPEQARAMSWSRPYNHGITLARGQWISLLDDDDELPPDHVERLLAAAIEHRLEMVYGVAWVEEPAGDAWSRIGAWPPQSGGFPAGAAIYSAGLGHLRFDEECWREGEPADWNLWRRMLATGVRMGFVDEIVLRHRADLPPGVSGP